MVTVATACMFLFQIIPRVYLEPEHQVMEREMDQPIRIMPFYDETITTKYDIVNTFSALLVRGLIPDVIVVSDSSLE